MKKALSLLLVLVLALSMSTVAFAAGTANGYTANNNGKNGKPIELTDTGDAAIRADFDGATISADSNVVDYQLAVADFNWAQDGTTGTFNNFTDGGLRMKEVDNGKIKVTAKVKSGAVLFDKAVIESDGGLAYLRVKTKGKFLVTSSDEIDLEVEVTMSVAGSKTKGTDADPWVLVGSYDPSTTMVEPESDDEGGDDISDGQLVKPAAYNPNWVGVLDGDDTIEGTFKLFKGRNFYIYAEAKVGDDDAETVDAYGFDAVYRLTYSANAVASVKHINFVEMSDGYYVYGSKSGQALKGKADVKKDLVYLGTSDQDLPLYNRYYLAASQIDLDIDDIIDEPTIDAPIPADDGGGDGYIPNVNDNPGTGK